MKYEEKAALQDSNKARMYEEKKAKRIREEKKKEVVDTENDLKNALDFKINKWGY